jgi:mannobiose 2-epimerase
MQTDKILSTTLSQVTLETKRLLDYWTDEAFNQEDQTFYGEIDFYGNKDSGANKCIIMYSRILWSFAAAYNHYKNDKYLVYAKNAYDFILKYFYDKTNGGYYWETDFSGKPVNRKKQTYAQAFVLYAFCEYYIATESKQPMTMAMAMELFSDIEKHCYDTKAGGYFEAFAEDWQILDDVSLSAKDENEQKSMNTNLHILEAYTRLLQAVDDEGVRQSLHALINDFTNHIVDRNYHVTLFFDENWNSRSSIISYGHDIEASWLLQDAAETVNDTQLKEKIETFILKMVDVFCAEGLHNQEAVYYEYFPEQKRMDTDRHWWPQVEAIEGLCNACRLTGNNDYLTTAISVWKYTQTHFPDRKNGEWHSVITEENRPDTSRIKTGAWKTLYHISRALMKFELFLEQPHTGK